MNNTVISIKKVSSHHIIQSMAKHNFRLGDANIYPHVDFTQTHLNRILINPEYNNYELLWQRAISKNNITSVRRNAILGFDILLSFSHEMKDNIDLDRWCDLSVEWLKEFFNEENVLSAVLHLDEQTPHIHAFVIPIDDGKLRGYKFLDKKRDYHRAQNSYAEKVKELGLIKGQTYSKGNGINIKHFYKMNEDAHKNDVPEYKPGEGVDNYAARIYNYVTDIRTAALKEIRDTKSKLAKSEGKSKEQYVEYIDAIHLQQFLITKLGDKKKAKEELQKLLLAEKNAPANIFELLFNKFAPNYKSKDEKDYKQEEYINTEQKDINTEKESDVDK